MTDYNDGKWHGYDGGGCPVDERSIVQIQTASETRLEVNKEPESHHREAKSWVWSIDGDGGDIIAFRVTKPYVEPREPIEVWVGLEGRAIAAVAGDKETVTRVFGVTDARLFREVLP